LKMEVIPAIDLMGGEVVRLLRGEPSTRKTYEHLRDPLTVARKWESEGARFLHIVDLDAAFGLGSNTEMIKAIFSSVGLRVQVGGGIRSLDFARDYLNMGINRVILGSLALEDPSRVKLILNEFGSDRAVIALDHLYGKVVVKGWKTPTNLGVYEAMSRFSSLGVKFFLVTSVARDGALTGPDLKTLSRICSLRGVYVMASGGISSLEDLINLKGMQVYGAIIGRALYEGRVRLREALKIAER